jgi:lipopolysaccharide export LptBFGC system permease protein LptF
VGVFPPDVVSWFPNLLFGLVAVVLLARVET